MQSLQVKNCCEITMRILREELKTKNIETLSPPVSSLTLLFLFFVLFFLVLRQVQNSLELKSSVEAKANC